MLVDEAQDFSSAFLRLCHTILCEPKRLMYAYDELQNLSGESLSSPEDVFGRDEGSAQYVVIVQYPIEEEKGSVGSSSLHVKHYPILKGSILP